MKDLDIIIHEEPSCSEKNHHVDVRVYHMELQPQVTSIGFYGLDGDINEIKNGTKRLSIGPEDHATIVKCCCLDAAAAVGITDVEEVTKNG